MYLSALIVVLFVCAHIFASKISFLNKLPRQKWLSLAGGVSVAFVFTHIFPELNSMQQSLGQNHLLPPFFENELYVVAMAGVLLFYGLEQVMFWIQARNKSDKAKATEKIIYRFHIGIFALFNSVIGYYLHHELEVDGISSFLTFTALGFHFLVIDYSLLRHHQKKYLHTGRWVMTGAVITGWGIGALLTIPDAVSYTLFALLAGAIVVNSFKEELPEERESNFIFFLAGTALYTLLWIL